MGTACLVAGPVFVVLCKRGPFKVGGFMAGEMELEGRGSEEDGRSSKKKKKRKGFESCTEVARLN